MSVEQELTQLKKLSEADINTFRKVAGIPTSRDIWRGRMIGFVSGIIASVVASGIVWGITLFF